MRILILALIIASAILSLAKSACGQGSIQCQDGHCTISGSGRINLIGSQYIKTLTLAAGSNECNTAIAINANDNITIETLIIDRNKANIVGSGELIFLVGVAGSGKIIIGNVKKGAGAGTNPSDIRFINTIEATVINKDNTDDVKITLPNGEVIQKQGTPTQTATQIVSNYANALNEQLNLESANAMILYNILNNYDGTYINYDYGFGNQIGIGAFNNGGFFRYYNKDSQNGFDVGAKYKIQVANRFYLRGAVYYMGFASTHSIVAGMGLLKDIDFALGSSGKAFFVLNPSLNIYYAATLKGKYMPTNHLGFFNAGLETGLRIKKTSLLLKGSYGYALNSLQSTYVDLGNDVRTNKTAFYSKLYHASFGVSQKLGKVALSGEVGAVFLDDKPYLKAGVMLNIIFGKNSQNDSVKDTTKTNKAKSSKSSKDSKVSAQKRESTPSTKSKTTANTTKTTPTRVPNRPINARETSQTSARANTRTSTQRITPSTKPNNTKARQTPPRQNPRQASQLPQRRI